MDKDTRSTSLYTDLQKGRLNQEECQRKCFEWLLEDKYWIDLMPKDFPVKTLNIVKHESIPEDERKNLHSNYFRKNPKVLEYYEEKDKIFYQNYYRLQTLEDNLKLCKTAEETTMVKAKIEIFKKKVIPQGVELNMKGIIREYFKTHKEIENIVNQFEGKII